MPRLLRRALLCVVLVTATDAGASTATTQDAEERPVPDYDRRGKEPTTAGDVLIWVPRVLMSPLYLVSEYVVRRPLGAVVTYAELNDWPAILIDFFTFGEERKAGIVPTALFDFGFRPSVEIYAFGDDFLFEDNDLRLHVATWGPSWLTGTLTNRTELRENDAWLSLRAFGERRKDWVFYGIGPLAPESRFSRYQRTEVGGSVLFEADVWRASSVVWEVRLSDNEFDGEACCSEDPVTQEFEGELPPGWEGYTALSQHVEVAFDTRRERPAPGDGVRLSLEGTHGFDLTDAIDRRWVRYGGNLSLYWDPTDLNRILRLTLTALFADPLGSAPVPFTELVSLGGTRYMRGYLEGRLLGRSAALATLEYRHPVWIWLDGTMHAAVGNVFGEHLDGFSPDLLRLSFGFGFRTVDTRDHSFDFLLAFGSEPFDRFEISSVRFLLGTTRGF